VDQRPTQRDNRPPEDLRAWRKQLRETLLAQRLALPPEALRAYREAIDRHLERGFPNLAHGIVALCWPYENEPDPRFIARRLREAGAVTALPVVVAPRAPLVFREWHPGVALARGVYDIPYPRDSREVVPDSVLLPMIAFDDAGYRLGYGGGFFDRTLAALERRPCVIGIAYEMAHVPTICPQGWDVPVNFVVTERGIYERRAGRLEFLGAPGPAGSALASPVCYAADVDPDYFGPQKT
jgi:5-formyltetrahydrofolate cyclo-ligase